MDYERALAIERVMQEKAAEGNELAAMYALKFWVLRRKGEPIEPYGEELEEKFAAVRETARRVVARLREGERGEA